MSDILKKVRLEEFQYEALRKAFLTEFLPEDHLWLFGSRTDMKKRGGDIDLYIETHANTAQDAYVRKNKFIDVVWDTIGEQKIDIVLNLIDLDVEELPIYRLAKTEGVLLV